jgi:hypothetical protein
MPRRMKHRLIRLAMLAALAPAACASFRATTPGGFVELPDQAPSFDYRATTHDGVVLAVRALDNDPRGDEAFWSQAIEGRLRQQGGYALLESRAVTSASGLTGRQLRFGHDEGSRPHLYYLTLFVTRRRIFLLEAGGARDPFQREAARIDGFVTSFVPK